ncbi:MBL fold metallo-hydrolase [Thiomicrolovo sp. ZZH C-3]
MKAIFFLFCISFTMSAADIIFTVLGSGGPETGRRAATGYLLSIEGKSRLLIDSGSGVMLRFSESGASLDTLEALAFTHLHIDHAVDLPSFIKAGYFSGRRSPLPVIGPAGNASFPSIGLYLQTLFGPQGTYRYMRDVLTPQSDSFELLPKVAEPVMRFPSFTLRSIPVHHGIVPALAYRIDIGEKSIVISGDTNDADGTLAAFAKGADLLIMHHAIPETGFEGARALHMTPSQIGVIAAKSGTNTVVLTHRMQRTIGREEASEAAIRRAYGGELIFAEDGMRFIP